MDFTLNPVKSAQAAAVLLKLNRGSLDTYKFIKMLYWADRVALEKWDEPITGATVASMEHGQVLSEIYDLTKGDCPWARADWEPFIFDADPENQIVLKSDPGTDDLSRAEIKILEESFHKFNDMRFSEVKNFFKKLPEHEEVGKTSKELPFKKILLSLGKSPDQVAEAERKLWDIRNAERLLGA
jgi:hypothetical protein